MTKKYFSQGKYITILYHLPNLRINIDKDLDIKLWRWEYGLNINRIYIFKWYFWVKVFGNNINFSYNKLFFVNCFILKQIEICVNNLKHPSLINTMKVFHIFTPFQFSNYKRLYFSCWLRGKSSIPLLNDKVKVLSSCVKNNIDIKNSVFELVGSRHFSLYNSLKNHWHTLVLKGADQTTQGQKVCFSWM